MDFLTNADHWRKRAELTRALAANAVKDQGRLLKVAEEYDRLAAHAERRRIAAIPAASLRFCKPGRIASPALKTVGRGGDFRFDGAWQRRRGTQNCAANPRCVTCKTQPPGNVQSIVIMRLQGNQQIA